jgi:hypothetical protein
MGIAKIAGKNIDDLSKLMGKDIISEGTAAVGDVKDPETFYAGSTALKTGTMPTVAVAPASSAYPAGYHAGDVGGLPAIDADLATANIKSGATIFNVAGAATVQDIADGDLTVAEALTGKKFYAVTGGVKTGTAALAENANAENTWIGTASTDIIYPKYDSVALNATILSGSITTTKRTMIVVVAVIVHPYPLGSGQIQRGGVDKTIEETISAVNNSRYSMHLLYATEVLDAGTYQYDLVNTWMNNLPAHLAGLKIIAVNF